MKRITIFLRLTLFFFILSAALPLYAQTSKGDQLFAEGQAFQKKKQYQKAIAKYKAAKVAYTSAEKKQMCDDQIKLCKPTPTPIPKDDVTEEKKDSLVISSKHIIFDADKEKTVEISVLTGDSCWTVDTSTRLYGDTAFTSVKKTSDGKSLRIYTDINNSTLSRHQHIFVSTNECADTIFVEQPGKNVILRTNENLLNYKKKGGSKSIEVITNSDSIVANNNNECWYVESKPEWVEANVDMAVETSQANLKKILGTKAKTVLSADEKASRLSITVVPLLKSDTEYSTGRRGEVVIAAQSRKYKVIIVQQ